MRSRSCKTQRPWGTTLMVALFLAFLLEGRAHAYLDPGSISLFFQALIAGVFGALLVIKRYWAQITDVIRRRFSSKPQDDEA